MHVQIWCFKKINIRVEDDALMVSLISRVEWKSVFFFYSRLLASDIPVMDSL